MCRCIYIHYLLYSVDYCRHISPLLHPWPSDLPHHQRSPSEHHLYDWLMMMMMSHYCDHCYCQARFCLRLCCLCCPSIHKPLQNKYIVIMSMSMSMSMIVTVVEGRKLYLSVTVIRGNPYAKDKTVCNCPDALGVQPPYYSG